jgi:hypothetical protein
MWLYISHHQVQQNSWLYLECNQEGSVLRGFNSSSNNLVSKEDGEDAAKYYIVFYCFKFLKYFIIILSLSINKERISCLPVNTKDVLLALIHF